MGQCPFCAGDVSEDILLFGGTCPHCFGLIPGEEAATDPGEAVKQELETADKRRAQRRALLPFVIALPVVAAVAGVSIWFALRPEPELAVLDFDDAAFTFEFDFLADADPDADSEPDAEQASPDRSGTAAGSSAPRPTGAAAGGSGQPDFRVARLGAAGDSQASGAASGSADAPRIRADDGVDVVDSVRKASDGESSGLGSDIDLGFRAPSLSAPRAADTGPALGEVRIGGAPLVGDADIRDMIRRRLASQLRRLSTCYTVARNARPDLAGDWVLEATVQTDGSVSAVSITGQGVSDDVLESCVVRQVERWRFEPIIRPVPFKKTVPFRPR